MTEWNMVAVLKVMPESPDADMDAIKSGIEKVPGEKAEIHTLKEVPIAFGLVSIELTLLMSDKVGGMEEIQESIKGLDGVGDVEVIDLNRL